MTPTIWQRPHLWINQFSAASPDLLRPYRALGYRVIQVKVDDLEGGVQVPQSWVRQLQDIGFVVWGAIWPDESPVKAGYFAVEEARRLVLNGVVVNAEDPIEAIDAAGHKWSEQFCALYRTVFPHKNLALNTFSGCGYLDHAAWRKANARLYLQTFPGSREPFAESVESLVSTAASWGWDKARVKPCFGVYKFNGQRADPAAMVASAKNAGTKGFVAYYGDGADLGEPGVVLKPLVQQALASGVAY